MSEKLSTDPYKGVRDFYPEDFAIQQYIYDTWSYTAESFGYERYDASVLEPAALYKATSAEKEEEVNEHRYTLTDREVTLRPEMTPTVARMIAKKRKELAFPVRWYSIPNLFRYERAQRGRLREHWQLNCDIFGADDYTADVELIALAYQIFMNFGASEDMFEIRINNRAWLNSFIASLGLEDQKATEFINLLDRKDKIDDFAEQAEALVGAPVELPEVADDERIQSVLSGLKALGIENVSFSASIVRGFNYYTGTVFEVFDTNPENNRAMLGGGRYDNLTALFSDEPVSGIGFGFGDVTMKNFLESHELMSSNITSPTLVVIPMNDTLNLEGQRIAQQFRQAGVSVATDISTRKVGKKLSTAGDAFVGFALVVGDDEVSSGQFVLKNLTDGEEASGTLSDLVTKLTE
mgnify:FL=1